MTTTQRETGFKILTLAVAVIGSVIGSYTAAKVELGQLEARMVTVERRTEVLEQGKLDVKNHDELVARIARMEAKTDRILELMLESSARETQFQDRERRYVAGGGK